MPQIQHPHCPVCHGHDVQVLSRSLAGTHLTCTRCGTRWGVSLEDEVLDMIAESRRRRRVEGSERPDDAG
jgi:hypothetical protein